MAIWNRTAACEPLNLPQRVLDWTKTVDFALKQNGECFGLCPTVNHNPYLTGTKEEMERELVRIWEENAALYRVKAARIPEFFGDAGAADIAAYQQGVTKVKAFFDMRCKLWVYPYGIPDKETGSYEDTKVAFPKWFEFCP